MLPYVIFWGLNNELAILNDPPLCMIQHHVFMISGDVSETTYCNKHT